MHKDEQRRDTCYVTEQKEACSVGHTWSGATLSINKRSPGAPRDARGRSVPPRDARERPGTLRDAPVRPSMITETHGRSPDVDPKWYHFLTNVGSGL